MDIRCERCLTEYELADDSVSEVGTNVQCTKCGHTFLARRPPREWVLETARGEIHRFAGLAPVQRWIVERKATRSDRISRGGRPFLRLEQVEELIPFLDVVDQADRARPPAVAAPSAPLGTQTRGPRTPIARPAPIRGTGALPEPLPELGPEIETALVRPRSRVGRFLVTVSVAGGVAYFGITNLSLIERQLIPPLALPGTGGGPSSLPAAAPTAGESAVEAGPGGGEALEEDPGATLPANALPSSAPPGSGRAPAPSAPVSPPAPPPAPAAPSTPPPPAATSPPSTAEAPHAPPGESTYAQLVAEGLRQQQDGSHSRARKLLETALARRPDGIEALTALGYVHIDRDRFDAAVGYFRRALAIRPHPPALFGLGEAYRHAGEEARALDAYRRFLAQAPNDRDAPVARRQIRALGLPARAEVESVPSTSSILQESAR